MKKPLSKGHSHNKAHPYCVQRRRYKETLQTLPWLIRIFIQTLSVLQPCLSLPGLLGTKPSFLRLNWKIMVQHQEMNSKLRASKIVKRRELSHQGPLHKDLPICIQEWFLAPEQPGLFHLIIKIITAQKVGTGAFASKIMSMKEFKRPSILINNLIPLLLLTTINGYLERP